MIRIINWQCHPAATDFIHKEEVNKLLKEWENAALEMLKETKADHIVYGYKKYFTNMANEETYELNLMITPLSDNEFYKITSSFDSNYLVYALHKGTNI